MQKNFKYMATTKKENPVEVKNPNNVPTKILAESIVEISKAFSQIEKSGLTQRGLIILLQDMCPQVSKGNIQAILRALPELENTYIKKVK